MQNESEIVAQGREYVQNLLGSELPEHLHYHNLKHTEEVVEAAGIIAENTGLNEDENETLMLAAWFHDTGFKRTSEDHEGESKRIAQEFLSSQNYPDRKIQQVLQAIEATRVPQSPKDKVSEILCDADLFHLSTKKFRDKSTLLRKELEANENGVLEESQWAEETLSFLEGHTYFTNYGQVILEPKKKKNRKKLEKLNGKPDEKDSKEVKQLKQLLVKTQNKLDAFKDNTPTRGIETMFRTTSRNHLTLSGMADNKANIMISVNSIILSIVLTVLFRKFEEVPYMLLPAIALTLTSLVTIIFAILATRPNVSSGTFTEDDIMNRKTNLLFFGNFHSMELNNYMWGMKEMMKDADYLYGSLIKDIYYLGVVLGQKYRLLRISYTIFMFGLILTILLFVVAEIYPTAFTFASP